MSFEYYANWWIVAKKNLQQLMSQDAFIRQVTKPIKDRKLANDLIGGLYAKYSMLVQELDICLDQMCQVQRRETVKKLVDSAVIRLQELSDELRKIDLSEFHYIDGNLIEMKIIPHDVEILHPRLFCHRPIEIEDMWRKIQQGEKIYIPPPEPPPEEVPVEATSATKVASTVNTEKVEAVEAPPDEKAKTEEVEAQQKEKEEKKKKRPKTRQFVPEVKVLSEAEQEAIRRKNIVTAAINLIQNHERRRQALLYWLEWNVKYQLRQLMLQGMKPPEPPDPQKVESAVRKIQAVWRGYSVRSHLKFKEKQRRLLIGMTEHSWKSTKELEKLEENMDVRSQKYEDNIRKFIEANLSEKARIVRVVAPRLMEDIGDEIREWFYQWYIRAKNFDKYPPPEKGGTIIVIRGETMTPEQWLDEVERKRRERVKNKGRNLAKERAEKEKKKKQEEEKKRKEREKKKKEEEKKKKKKRKPSDFEYEFEDTKCKDLYQTGQKEYRKFWKNRDIFENPTETHYMDLIQDEKYFENQLEVRAIVDEMMRLELEMLEDALERDRRKLRKGKGKKKKKEEKEQKEEEKERQKRYDC